MPVDLLQPAAVQAGAQRPWRLGALFARGNLRRSQLRAHVGQSGQAVQEVRFLF